MQNKSENTQLIEQIIRQNSAFQNNQDLFEEIFEESSKRLNSFLENSSDLGSSEVYIKKIVNSVILDIIKNKENIRAEKAKKSEEKNNFTSAKIKYKTDKNGKILYEPGIDLSSEKPGISIQEKNLESFKKKIKELNAEKPDNEYKRIFELRFVREMSYPEIAKKLEMDETEVLNTLQEIFKEAGSCLETNTADLS